MRRVNRGGRPVRQVVVLTQLPPPSLRWTAPPAPTRTPIWPPPAAAALATLGGERRRRHWPRWLDWAVAAAIVVIGLRLHYAPVGGLLFLWIVMTPAERLFRRHRYPKPRPALRGDLTHALVDPIAAVPFLVVAVAAVLLASAPYRVFGLQRLVASQPGWVQAIEAFVLFDLLGYWVHRAEHRVAWFWQFHSVHHSSRRLDWLAGFRDHPASTAIGVGLAGVPVVLLGFTAKTVGALAVLNLVTGLFAHANVRWKLRPLHRVVLTPEFHHWHHSSDPHAYDSNFAGFLPLWDVVFGTYFMPGDRRPEAYGVSEPIPTTWWGQFRYPFRKRATVPVAARPS